MLPSRNCPAVHVVAIGVQEVAPASEVVFAGHELQMADPLVLENVPAAQAVQDVAAPPAE